jgi:hypothetical protein
MMSRLRGYSHPGPLQHKNIRINKALRSLQAQIATIPHRDPRARWRLLGRSEQGDWGLWQYEED